MNRYESHEEQVADALIGAWDGCLAWGLVLLLTTAGGIIVFVVARLMQAAQT